MRILGITLCCLGFGTAMACSPYLFLKSQEWIKNPETTQGPVVENNQNNTPKTSATCTPTDSPDACPTDTLVLCKTTKDSTGSECHGCVGWWEFSAP